MYYEDFTLHETIQAGSRKITGEDVDRFVDLVRLHNRIFLSDEGAREMGHPARVVPGPFQFSLAMGLGQEAGLFDHMIIGAQFDQVRFLRPVHPGETLALTARPVKKRLTSRPDRGVVTLDYSLDNQRGEPVLTLTGTYLFLTRDGQDD